VRWQDREAASSFPSGDGAGARDEVRAHAAEPAAPLAPKPDDSKRRLDAGRAQESSVDVGEASGGVVRLGTYRDLWASEVADQSPALRFLAPRQTLELAPLDADRLEVGQGDEVEVRSNGTSLRARVMIRERVRPGSGFLIEGTAEANANALPTGELVEVTKAGGEA
jgi:anaerobic selenocysteine-containing dehydrogenase